MVGLCRPVPDDTDVAVRTPRPARIVTGNIITNSFDALHTSLAVVPRFGRVGQVCSNEARDLRCSYIEIAGQYQVLLSRILGRDRLPNEEPLGTVRSLSTFDWQSTRSPSA